MTKLKIWCAGKALLLAGLTGIIAQTQTANYFPYKIDASIGSFVAGGSADYVGTVGVGIPTSFSIDSVQVGTAVTFDYIIINN